MFREYWIEWIFWTDNLHDKLALCENCGGDKIR
jgi:hypothetical protein